MPNLSSLDSVYLVLAFIVPGLIISFVRSRFVTGRMTAGTDAALTYLALSVIYYAIVLPGVGYIVSLPGPTYQKALAWFALIFGGPALFGLLLGIDIQKEYSRRFVRCLGFNPVHVMPTAWDRTFAGMKEQWVLVILKDGTQFAGLCGVNSFVSSDPQERDIFIERVYDIDDEKVWRPRENSVLITGGEIQTIEFWPLQLEESHDE